jgi:hypothetical protein
MKFERELCVNDRDSLRMDIDYIKDLIFIKIDKKCHTLMNLQGKVTQ